MYHTVQWTLDALSLFTTWTKSFILFINNINRQYFLYFTKWLWRHTFHMPALSCRSMQSTGRNYETYNSNRVTTIIARRYLSLLPPLTSFSDIPIWNMATLLFTRRHMWRHPKLLVLSMFSFWEGGEANGLWIPFLAAQQRDYSPVSSSCGQQAHAGLRPDSEVSKGTPASMHIRVWKVSAFCIDRPPGIGLHYNAILYSRLRLYARNAPWPWFSFMYTVINFNCII